MIKDPNCKNKNYRMLDLDYVIIEAITNLAIDPAYIEQVRANKPKNDVSEKVKTINAEVEKVETKISRLMDLYADGQIDMAAISNKVSALNAEKTALKKELDSLDIPDTEKAGMSNEQIQQLADLINDKDLDLTERRAIVQSLVYYVEIDNEDIIIHWKF
jgi:site-specific DNA recombinase